MEGEVVGSKSISCVCKLPIKRKLTVWSESELRIFMIICLRLSISYFKSQWICVSHDEFCTLILLHQLMDEFYKSRSGDDSL